MRRATSKVPLGEAGFQRQEVQVVGVLHDLSDQVGLRAQGGQEVRHRRPDRVWSPVVMWWVSTARDHHPNATGREA